MSSLKGYWRQFIGAVGLLTGAIIGAGIFSLPYIAQQSGLVLAGVLLCLAAAAYTYIHLLYADVVFGAAGQHRFVGYVRQYLGPGPAVAAIVIAVIQTLFVLTIYLILGTSFMRLVLPTSLSLYALLIFWLLSSATIFLSSKRLAGIELLATIGIAAIITTLFVLAAPQLSGRAWLVGDEQGSILLALAALFFAFSGRVAIPPLVQLLKKGTGGAARGLVRRTIAVGTLVPAGMYALFIVAVLALSGVATPDTVTGLSGVLSPSLVIFLGVLGVLTIWSSYILLGRNVYETLAFDLDVPAWLRLFMVTAGPLVLYLLGFTDIIALVTFVGGLLLVFEAALIILLWQAARKRRALGGVTRPPLWIMVGLWVMLAAACAGVLASRV